MNSKYYPSFYGAFKCLASDCPDTCCAGWEIPVDAESEKYYRGLKTPFGCEICENMSKNTDGDTVFTLNNGLCPFLDVQKLCRIRTSLGYEHTCVTCRQHPDFIEEYDDYAEICPSASCPAAVRLILSPDASYPSHTSESADGYLVFLLLLRGRILEMLESASGLTDVLPQLTEIVYSAENEYSDICPYDDIPLEYNEEKTLTSAEIIHYCNEITAQFGRNEILTSRWRDIVSGYKSPDEDSLSSLSGNDSAMYVKALEYLVFRYFTKAVNGYSSAALFRLLVCCVYAFAVYSDTARIPFAEVFRLASKETEHSEENISAFAGFFL